MKKALFEELKKGCGAEAAGSCHDCGCEVNLSSEKSAGGEISVKGGAVYEAAEEVFLKCEECFKKEKKLKNHQSCEVYSRVVGYLRPINQWNKGKLAEYEKRKMLKV